MTEPATTETARFNAPEPEHFESAGATLALRIWEPEAKPKALLQLVHGMAEHIARYDHLARTFCAAGYVVFGHDHRGHGKSASESTLGQMGDFGTCVEDIARVGNAVRARFEEGLPMGLFAHSLGSFMTQELILRTPAHAGAWALSGSNGKPPPLAQAGRLIARFERWRKSPERPSELLQTLSFGKFNDEFEGRTEFDWLSRDDEQVDRYVHDPLCGFGLSTASWVSLLDSLGPASDPYRQRTLPPSLPLYLVGGARDPVSEQGKGMRKLAEAYRMAGLQDVTLELYEGARHEIVNETNRDEVIAALLDWFNARLTP